MALTYAFRLPPGPQALDHAVLAEKLGYDRIWSPEIPAFGHDIWVHLARIAERTDHIGIGPAVLTPSYRHPVAQASAIATLEHIAPGRLMVAFGTGFTGRIAMGQKPLSWEAMRCHLLQVRALLRGEPVDIDGGMAQLLASPGLLPNRPIRTPLLLAAQGPKGRAVAKEIADGLIALRMPGQGFNPSLVSVNGTVLDVGETARSPRVRAAVAPLMAIIYHNTLARDPEAVTRLPNGQAWLESVMQVPEPVRHLAVNRGHNWDISNGHDALIDTGAAEQMTFTGTPDALRARLAKLEAAGATGVIFGTSGADVERELHAFARLVDLRPR
jgi:5,10-methylenetetrahydromethanopterin reductase